MMDDLDKLMMEYGVDGSDFVHNSNSHYMDNPDDEQVARSTTHNVSIADQDHDFQTVNESCVQHYLPQPSSKQTFEDDIAEFGSSEAYENGLSSPTPSYRVTTMLGPAQSSGKRMHRSEPGSSGLGNRELRQHVSTAYTQDQSSSPPHSDSSARGRNPRNAHGLRLIPVSELPDVYRSIFKFGVFNAVQSRCFDKIMSTKENLVVSAPTGGGKTVLFELSLIELLLASGHTSSQKCVYVAPTKALCSERTRDWTAKFEPLGIKCCEMTGDTVQTGKNAWNAAKGAKVIITTSEKWDSLTRSWHDHGEFLSEVKLFLVDEVHVLNEQRGSTLEVVISRMKLRGLHVRFLLVSATVPNIHDIANWIGNETVGTTSPATVYEFGEEYRPCKLTRHVYGYPRKNQNEFSFSRSLDFKIYSILQQHACGKPILIFCNTRKGVLSTAEQLLKDFEQAISNRESTPWQQPRQLDRVFHDKRIEKLARAGIGIHHAGLNFDDRREIETLFLEGYLRVVTATSTLAVGVNLPAHTVVIKGVKLFQSNAWQEYSDLDIVQMIGRAGRPQFDKEGVAIIMCELELEHKYRTLVQGRTVLESSLHQNLTEHLNSEIGLGTITNLASAKDWVCSSFLRQRIEKNPGHYHLGKSVGQTWEERMEHMVMLSVKKLKESELLETEGTGEVAGLTVTEYGDIMSKYYIRQSTMGRIMKLTERPSIRDILEVISCAEELGDVRLRGGDKQIYKKMSDHPEIRYRIKKIEKSSDKAFILIQAVLGGIPLSAPEYKTPDSQPTLDALSVFRHTARIARVVVEVAIVKKNGAQLKHGLELMRCLTAKAWEDRPIVLRQVESIGEKSIKVLAEHGITSLQDLRKQEPSRIEVLLGRRAPFGHEVLAFLQCLPQYDLIVAVDDISSYNGKKPVSVTLTITCSLLEPLNGPTKAKQRSKFPGMTTLLTTTSDFEFIDFRRIATKALKEPRSFAVTAELSKPSQSVCVYISSENYAGINMTSVYKPPISAREYPILVTHPKTSEEMLIEAVENDPDFWNNDVDEDQAGQEAKPKQTDTHPEKHLNASQTAIDDAGALPNGNYACNHPCKDKTQCRHLCCREGLPKPTQTSKRPAGDPKNRLIPGGTEKSTKKLGDKIAEKENRDLTKLDSLHKQAGVNKSLRLPEGKSIKLKPHPIRSEKTRPKEMNFDVVLADIKEKTGIDEEIDCSEEMPDTKELIANAQSKTPRAEMSDYSEDSELDAIMRTVDTEDCPIASLSSKSGEKVDNAHPQQAYQTSKTDKKQKREHSCTTQNILSPESSNVESSSKKMKTGDHYSRSDDVPLFLPKASASSTSPHAPAVSMMEDDTEPDEESRYVDVLAPDSTLFDIIPSDLNDTMAKAHSSPPNNLCELRDCHKGAYSGAEDFVLQRQIERKGHDEQQDFNFNDDWADLVDWMENGDALEVVDQEK